MSILTKTEGHQPLRAVKFAWMVLTVLAVAAPASAAGIDLKKIPKLVERELTPEFTNTTKLVREDSPYKDETLTYELRLPEGWTDNVQQPPVSVDTGKTLLSNTILGILGRYIGAPKNFQRSTVTIEALSLDYEISAQNWFVDFIVRNGFSMSALSERSLREVEALYVNVEKEDTFIVRARVLINGPRLVMIRHSVPQDNYEEEKVQQGQIIGSFRLVNDKNEPIERRIEHGFLDQSYFSYPASWKLKERSVLTIERMMALLYQESMEGEGSRIDGHIRVNVVSRLLKTTLAQEIEKFNKETKIPGYKVGGVIEGIPYKYNKSIALGKAEAYALVPDDPVRMKDYEFIVSIMQGQDYYYIVSLITPSRKQDFYMWAKNMEAFKIVAETMRRNNALPEIDQNDPYFDYLKDVQ